MPRLEVSGAVRSLVAVRRKRINEEERQPQFLGISPAVSRRERHTQCLMTPLFFTTSLYDAYLQSHTDGRASWASVLKGDQAELEEVASINTIVKAAHKCQCMARCGATELWRYLWRATRPRAIVALQLLRKSYRNQRFAKSRCSLWSQKHAPGKGPLHKSPINQFGIPVAP
jgi:hypothetical protein